MEARRAMTVSPIPTPMPIFAPVERPGLLWCWGAEGITVARGEDEAAAEEGVAVGGKTVSADFVVVLKVYVPGVYCALAEYVCSILVSIIEV